MRPRKTILLVGENDYELSPLRFTLCNARPNNRAALYGVATATTVPDAIADLQDAPYDLLLVKVPLSGLDKLLDYAWVYRSLMKQIVLIDLIEQTPDGEIDAVLCRPNSADLLEKIRFLTQRKRGPMKAATLQEISSRRLLAMQ